jgi:hypothetical protein
LYFFSVFFNHREQPKEETQRARRERVFEPCSATFLELFLRRTLVRKKRCAAACYRYTEKRKVNKKKVSVDPGSFFLGFLCASLLYFFVVFFNHREQPEEETQSARRRSNVLVIEIKKNTPIPTHHSYFSRRNAERIILNS